MARARNLRLSLISMCGALFGVFALLGAAMAESGRVVKIGVLTDLSGKAAYMGYETLAAAELLKQELESQGKRVELVMSDHGLDPAKAVTEAQKLIAIDKVDAVFSNFSGTSRAANPVVKNANRLFVYTAAAVEPLQSNENAFKSYLDYVEGCRRIAEHWKAKGIQTLGVLKAEAEFGELCLDGAKKVFPEPIVVTYKLGDDVSTPIVALKAKHVQALLNAGYEGDMSNMLKAMRTVQWQVPVGANENIYTEKILADFASELKDAVAFGMPKVPAEFIEKIKKIDTKNLKGAFDQAGMSYVHLKQMFAAISGCAANDLACQAKALKASSAEPGFGFLGWDSTRQASYVWTVSTFQDGRFQTVP